MGARLNFTVKTLDGKIHRFYSHWGAGDDGFTVELLQNLDNINFNNISTVMKDVELLDKKGLVSYLNDVKKSEMTKLKTNEDVSDNLEIQTAFDSKKISIIEEFVAYDATKKMLYQVDDNDNSFIRVLDTKNINESDLNSWKTITTIKNYPIENYNINVIEEVYAFDGIYKDKEVKLSSKVSNLDNVRDSFGSLEWVMDNDKLKYKTFVEYKIDFSKTNERISDKNIDKEFDVECDEKMYIIARDGEIEHIASSKSDCEDILIEKYKDFMGLPYNTELLLDEEKILESMQWDWDIVEFKNFNELSDYSNVKEYIKKYNHMKNKINKGRD